MAAGTGSPGPAAGTFSKELFVSRRNKHRRAGNPLSPKRQYIANQQRRSETKPFGSCIVCGQALGKAGGYAGTDLCGPCCTGESDTISERGDTW